MRKRTAALAAFGLAALSAVVLAPLRAGADEAITSAGPLTNVTITSDLNCAVSHSGDSHTEWFGDTACGTFVSVGGTLYGPASIPAGSSATAVQGYVPFTAVAQTTAGTGTSMSPFVITTTVALGTSGLRVTETDSYVVGQETYRTTVALSGTPTATAIIYHGGDCYLQDSDRGRGRVDNGNSPVCLAEATSTNPDRIEGMYPLTAGSRYIEDEFSVMWAAIGAQEPLPNTCVCDGSAIDNGLALGWTVSVPAGGAASVSLLTVFSPVGATPLTFAKTADAGSVPAGGSDGYTVTVSNSGAADQTLTSITDTLPAGFTYTTGSSSGATTTDPLVDGSNVTWRGQFLVPGRGDAAPGTLTLHFGVTVASTSGTYLNSVTGAGDGVTAVAATNVAPVQVTASERPVATDDSYSTPFNTPLSQPAPGVLANDSTPRDANLTVDTESVTAPAHGTVTPNRDGSFVYTPAPGFSGTDSFTYQASDGTSESAPATVRITVGANGPPTANSDTYSTDEDTALDVGARSGVLANDTDPEQDALSATVAASPRHGTLTLHRDGSFIYVPVADYNGPDSFTYTASDGTSSSAPALVSLTVDPVNDPIVAHDDEYTTAPGTTLRTPAPGVLGNDTDPDGRAVASVIEGSGPTHGTLQLAEDGSFVYAPADGFEGDDTFDYSAGDETRATVTIHVKIDHAPVAGDDAYTTAEDTVLVRNAALGLLNNDTDRDGDTVIVGSFTQPAHGHVTVHPDGSFSYAPTANYSGPDSFTYRARAGELLSDPATVSITVTPVSDAPTGRGDAFRTPQNTTLHVAAPGVTGNDSDPDGDPLTAVLTTGTRHGTLTLAADGGFTYAPASGFAGADGFTYRAVDPTGRRSAPITVTIAVLAPEHAPVAAADAYQTPRNVRLRIATPGVLGNDTDADGNALRAILDRGTRHGTLRLFAGGALRYTPDRGFAGTDTFRYHASDGLRSSGSVLVTIRVIAPVVITPPGGGFTFPDNPGNPIPPTQPTQPSQPSRPTQPSQPTAPTQGSQPSTPTSGTDPVTATGRLALALPSINPGGSLAVRGSGCAAGVPVVLTVNGQAAGQATSRSDGSFDVTLTAPQLGVGTYPVAATCGNVRLAANVALVNVTSDSAAAGAQAVTVGAVIAFFLLLLGLTLRRPAFKN